MEPEKQFKKATLPPKKNASAIPVGKGGLPPKKNALPPKRLPDKKPSENKQEPQFSVARLLMVLMVLALGAGAFYIVKTRESSPEISREEQKPNQLPDKKQDPTTQMEVVEIVESIGPNAHKLRVATFNVQDFKQRTLGGDQTKALSDHVARYRPDVLTLQEIASFSVPLITDDFAKEHGFDYSFAGAGEARGIVLLSKHRILFSEMVKSPSGSNEFARKPRYIEIEVLGRRVGIYGIHKATWAYHKVDNDNPELGYERAVETERIKAHLKQRRRSFPGMEFIIMGDHNEGPGINHASSYEKKQTINGVPVGSDIQHPIVVGNPPFDQIKSSGIRYLRPRDGNGRSETLLGGGNPNPKLLDKNKCEIDFIGHTMGLTPLGSEIVNSEAPVFGGLEKFGNTLSFDASRRASDHLMIVADFN